MSYDINYFKAIQGAIGVSSNKEAIVREERDKFQREIQNSIHFCENTTRNGIIQPLFISPVKGNKNKCTIHPVEYGGLGLGDMIAWNGKHWLVTDIDFGNEITQTGVVELCSHSIKWQNPTDNKIITRYFCVKKVSDQDVDNNKMISSSTGEYIIKIPYDSETQLVDVDKRFLIGKTGKRPQAYRIIDIDVIGGIYTGTQSGVLTWALRKSEFNPSTDNADLMIADYNETPSATLPSLPNDKFMCEIVGKSTIKSGLGINKYSSVFYEEDKRTVTTAVLPVWDFLLPSEHEGFYDVSEFDGVLSLRAKNNEDIIGDVIVIRLSDNEGIYQPVALEVEVVSAFG